MPRERPPGTSERGTGRPRVIIVGGGIAGLASGCYAQMSGMDTRIFERHVLPGGGCTAWARKGYVFDYCIEWLLGTAAGNEAHQVWRELGALDGKSVRNFEMFNRVVGEDGRAVTFYRDPDRLERHLLELSPEDAEPIRAFCRYLRRFTELEGLFSFLKPKALLTPREKLRTLRTLLPAMGLFYRTATTQMESFTERFKDPLLRRAFPFIFFQDHETFPLLPYLFNLAAAYHDNAGFPQGGSLGLSRSIERRYLELGGDISYRARVRQILVEEGRAVGVELRDGTRHFADHVIGACDGRTMIYDLLGGRYTGPRITRLYTDLMHRPQTIYHGVVSAFVGFRGDVAPDAPHSTTYLLRPEDVERLPGVLQRSLVVQLRSRYSDGFAPPGHSVIHCTYFSDYAYWKSLRQDSRREYRARKAQVAEFIRDFLDREHPGLAERVEVLDVATPATHHRYTGTIDGSILGWKSFSDADDVLTKVVNKDRMRLPGLAGFSMAGQWVHSGGLISAAASGRFAVQFLCDELGVPFRAWESEEREAWHPGLLGHLPQLDKPVRLDTRS
ncbi:phytoene desaturase family protein [Streptomyces hainanensis]|uniref:NAD(P)/FAD-dependent oxidoreductase n=1 Tax=Streptomyces hainanensis TaxID=402648 RepID=A0A4R4TJA0_9ACTN|nr:NAD(P)/FAD-dependent oxidoreductase [Streptomyces hainanensis]TDC75352.1 NAD(P)/FAD-dependent oxidoreductase [Streptomyces hainanensis]